MRSIVRMSACAISTSMLGALAIWAVLPAVAQGTRPVAGLILEIRAPAFLKPEKTGVETQLDPERDKGRRLLAGESLRCGPGGYIRAEIYGVFKEIAGSDGGLTIPLDSNVGQDPRLNERQRRISEALRSYGRIGGTRGIGSSISLPAEGSVVRADHFEIRWMPPETGSAIAISVQTKSGRLLWQADKVPAVSGSLDSAGIRDKLEHYQQSGGQEALILSLRDSEGNENRVDFSLLSAQAEDELRQELAQWDQDGNGLVRHIGRASVFSRRRMLVEAAQEYDAALTLASESRDLLETAIAAHHYIGDYAGERELIKRLPPANK